MQDTQANNNGVARTKMCLGRKNPKPLHAAGEATLQGFAIQEKR
jgi:hypothetical protein